MDLLVLVHVGAGNHQKRHLPDFKALVSRACSQGLSDLISSDLSSTTKALSNTSKLVEASKLTNASYGSSLSYNGKIVNDACVLLKDHASQKFVSFALSNIQNFKYPITRCLNFLLLKEIDVGQFCAGITKPCVFADNHFDYFNINRDRPSDSDDYLLNDGYCNNISLLSSNSINFYRQNEDRFLKNEPIIKDNNVNNNINDTIGILINDSKNSLSHGVSSGGNFFKSDQRIGCAGLIGPSLFNLTSLELPLYEILSSSRKKEFYYEISTMCSGNGEDIIEMDLARFASTYILENLLVSNDEDDLDLSKLLQDSIVKASKRIHLKSFNYQNKNTNADKNANANANSNTNQDKIIYVGVISYIRKFSLKSKKIVWNTILYCHSTESFIFGYKYNSNKTQFMFSSLLDPKRIGVSFSRGEFILK
ncbi:N-terminal nucleophile aminohydrolase [Ascoidea rubescens DSM 1968]|uniref:N-terminal nucleophile aminohydrolase n=1 Tax=Ascoidea rubescens DSM 1968 TaxID=1344418 RepID=A0A1D2VLX0_9ASCO|nr:N-terminal nucleophile aminohydrolase [Ascoidea rubescens DSM 1968]ODV62603.1 N-terminal nucleophile aminohydrolase [Ascoidea rubescens DSM 1968]